MFRAQEPTTGPTIESVTYGANYVETTATDDDTVNSPSASSNVSAVTLSDGTEITAENGGVLTLVINGEQYDIPDYYHNHLTLPEAHSPLRPRLAPMSTVRWASL